MKRFNEQKINMIFIYNETYKNVVTFILSNRLKYYPNRQHLFFRLDALFPMHWDYFMKLTLN